MLKSRKIVELKQVQPTHEALFAELYEELRKKALHLTERDHDLAADLLHDTYVQFTLSRPDLDSILHHQSLANRRTSLLPLPCIGYQRRWQ